MLKLLFSINSQRRSMILYSTSVAQVMICPFRLSQFSYFSKPKLEHWRIRFEGITHTKHKLNNTMVYPQKHTILGERGNTLLTTEEAIEEALNADESPAEMQAWGDMICLNDVNMTGSDQGEVGDAGETAADDAVEGKSESKAPE